MTFRGKLLENRVILVTGSTTGIGAAVARLAVEEGARVMVHGRDEERARRVAGELGEAAACEIADLAEPANCDRLVDAVLQRFGRIDGLVNNAAAIVRSNIDTTDPELFDRVIAVNLRAPLLLIRAAMPHFRRQGRGAVVNVGSINALCGEPNQLAYSVSKGGLMTMTRNLADAHCTEKIRINQLNVGWTATENEMALKQREGLAPGWEKSVIARYAPSGRLLTPAQIAAHAVYWLSDVSAPVNGVVYEAEQYPMVGRMGSYQT